MKEQDLKLEKFTAAIKDERRLVNLEHCRHCPELDQNMLLALNRTAEERVELKRGFPNQGAIRKWLKDRLIEVRAPNQQTVILGAFFTTLYPLKHRPVNDSIDRKAKVVVGIFPLYDAEVKYEIHPHVKKDPRNDSVNIFWESAAGKDPFLVKNFKGLDFLFFQKSPFKPNHPYKIEWPKEHWDDIWYPKLLEMSLEENVISHALYWLDGYRNPKPELFKKEGFSSFINSHCSDQRYIELHAAYTQFRNRKQHKP